MESLNNTFNAMSNKMFNGASPYRYLCLSRAAGPKLWYTPI